MKKTPLIVWRVIWCSFYIGVIILNCFYSDSMLVKVLSCVGIGLNILYAYKVAPKDHLLQIALAFTLLADMVIALDSMAFMGVFVFVFAQFFHFARLAKLETKYFLWFLIALTLTVYLTSLLGIEPIFAMGVFYACFLGGNLLLSIMWYRKSHTKIAFNAMLGFLLFAMCDLCVACSYFSRVGIMPFSINEYVNDLSWIFYYPSQILIANSSRLMSCSARKYMIQ